MTQIQRLLNSNGQFALDDSFTLNVGHATDPGHGGGRVRLGTIPIKQLLHHEKCLVLINNNDELCCARALVTMKAYVDMKAKDNTYRNLKDGHAIQTARAQALHRDAGVVLGACGFEEIT